MEQEEWFPYGFSWMHKHVPYHLCSGSNSFSPPIPPFPPQTHACLDDHLTFCSTDTITMKFIKCDDPSFPPTVPAPLSSPHPSEPALVVTFEMNVADISEIDPLTFTCEVDLEMILFWTDPRLIGRGAVDH